MLNITTQERDNMFDLILLATILVVWWPRQGVTILLLIWAVCGTIITAAGLYLIVIPCLIILPIKNAIHDHQDAFCVVAESFHMKDAQPLSSCISQCMNGLHIPGICRNLYKSGAFSIDGRDLFKINEQNQLVRSYTRN